MLLMGKRSELRFYFAREAHALVLESIQNMIYAANPITDGEDKPRTLYLSHVRARALLVATIIFCRGQDISHFH